MTTEPTRRQFLQAGAATGAAFVLGISLRAVGTAGASAAAGSYSPDAFIRIDQQGQVTLVMPQVEMGQGIYTALAMIVAEELDVDLQLVVLEHAPPDDSLYGNPLLGFQVTGGSTSVRAFWVPLRKAAAIARATLVRAAAALWQVDPGSIRTHQGEALHEPSGRRIGYGGLVPRARALAPVKSAEPKDPRNFQLLGKSRRRLDTPDKVNGRAVFAIDVLPAGLHYASLRCCPMFGGRVGTVDSGGARAVAGVRDVLQFKDFVAVVAADTWSALRGRKALSIHWEPGGNSDISTDDIWDKAAAASSTEGEVARSEGDALQELSQGDVYEAVYQLPLLAHAAMEPLNCTAHVTPASCEVWVGIQVCARAQSTAARVCGLPLGQVRVHNHLLGGGFGRRLEADFVEKAVQIAQRVDGPVKVMWTREEDMQHDVYRPIYLDNLSARVQQRRISAWKHRVTGSSIIARWLPPAFQKGIDADAVDAGVDIPYAIPNFRVEYVRDEPFSVPTGFWRGVGPNNNVFAVESFMDELAYRVRQDPVAFRRAHLPQAPRFAAALDLVAQKSGWGTPLPARSGRGVSVSGAFGSYLATVVQVQVEDSGEVRVQRVTCAVDAGLVVNPDTVVAQIEGGILFGLTAALWGKVDIRDGRVVQSNFNDYRV
ncbi:MAG: xanthine dehydrogenase family protein molybdopterin-binding subunit, partial [Sinobacteraceae bacterium]|nr:xanthine dehydrogenase family protein molybdopterin-binding subunit [Nevskiaceae bacterium]